MTHDPKSMLELADEIDKFRSKERDYAPTDLLDRASAALRSAAASEWLAPGAEDFIEGYNPHDDRMQHTSWKDRKRIQRASERLMVGAGKHTK